MSTAVVIGSGPNGLAAAATMAKAGVDVTVLAADDIGGGTHTHESLMHGLVQDQCSAVHMMAVGSAAVRDLGLESHGLR